MQTIDYRVYKDQIGTRLEKVFLDYINYQKLHDCLALHKANWRNRKNRIPQNKVDLFLNLSTFCNYNCVFCNRNVDAMMIGLDDIKNLNELLSHANMVDITGYGEITIHPDFREILKSLTRKNIPIRFVTNGSMLSGERLDALFNSSLKELVISLNSLDPITYNYLNRSKFDLEKILENVKIICSRDRRFGVIFSFVINSHNFKEIKDFIDFGKKNSSPVACLGLTPTLMHIYPPGLEIKDNPENRKYLADMKEYAQQIGVQASLPILENQSTSEKRIDQERLKKIIQGCDWVYNKFFIEPDGKVKACCWSSVVLGDIKEQSFEEIWLGSKYQELREEIKNGSLKYCSKCRRIG